MYYFASDIHLGAGGEAFAQQTERRFVRWLDDAAQDAEAIFLVGDVFDFWFEYRGVDEACKEGGERCFRCYRLRLERTAALAKNNAFDFFCTTLSISPLKNSQKINEIGFELEKNTALNGCRQILRKKRATSAQLCFPRNIIFIAKIFAAVHFLRRKVLKIKSELIIINTLINDFLE